METWALDTINEHVTPRTDRKQTPSIFSLPSSNSTTTVFNTSGSPLTASAIASSSFSAVGPAPGAMTSPKAIASNGALISRLMRLAQLCGHEKLLATMIGVLKQLMGYSIQYAHLAMTLADELELRALRGIAYFEVMQKANVVVVTTSHRRTSSRSRSASGDRSAAADEDGEEYPQHQSILDGEGRLLVTAEQKMRLLMGYHRLTLVWERLRATPPTFEHAAACSATWHQHGCTQCWLDFWKEKTKSDTVLSLGLADVLGRLRAIAKEFVRWGSATYMHQDCRATVRKAIQEKILMVEESLPDYFAEEACIPPL